MKQAEIHPPLCLLPLLPNLPVSQLSFSRLYLKHPLCAVTQLFSLELNTPPPHDLSCGAFLLISSSHRLISLPPV